MSRRQLGTTASPPSMRKPSALEDLLLVDRAGTSMPPSAAVRAGSNAHALRLDRRLAGAGHPARLAAANVEDQAGQDRQPVVEEGRVDAALEAAARIAGQLQLLAGPGDIARA